MFLTLKRIFSLPATRSALLVATVLTSATFAHADDFRFYEPQIPYRGTPHKHLYLDGPFTNLEGLCCQLMGGKRLYIFGQGRDVCQVSADAGSADSNITFEVKVCAAHFDYADWLSATE